MNKPIVINEVKNFDVFDYKSPDTVYVCPVNTVGVMGAGLAKIFKDKYPEVFSTYRMHLEIGYLDIGKVSIAFTFSDGQVVILFPTKAHWKNPSKIEYIASGLESLKLEIEDRFGCFEPGEYCQLCIPELGCGLGGLNYQTQVKPLILETLNSIEVDYDLRAYISM